MANPEHIRVLEEGVQAWNRWRSENPEVSPDLSGVDFCKAFARAADSGYPKDRPRVAADQAVRDLTGINFSNTNLHGSTLQNVDLTGANLSDADLSWADLDGAVLADANLDEADLERARYDLDKFAGAKIINARFGGANPAHVAVLKQGVAVWNDWRAQNPEVVPVFAGSISEPFDFLGTFKGSSIWRNWRRSDGPGLAGMRYGLDLKGVNLSGAYLGPANMSGSNLDGADLSDADLYFTDLRGSYMSRANLQRAKMFRTKLQGAYLSDADVTDADFTNVGWDRRTIEGVPKAGLETLDTNPVLLRDWRDEQFIVAVWAKEVLASEPNTTWDFFAIHRLLLKPTWILLALFGAMCGLVARAPSSWGDLSIAWVASEGWRAIAIGFLTGALSGLVLLAHWGRHAVHFVWRLFDYGRSWPAVAMFAGIMIFSFGSAYALWLVPAGDVRLIVNQGADHWIHPWFVATMGFATLGVGDYVTPLTGLGRLVIVANVVSGFATFGLLLAVLGNTFARRAS